MKKLITIIVMVAWLAVACASVGAAEMGATLGDTIEASPGYHFVVTRDTEPDDTLVGLVLASEGQYMLVVRKKEKEDEGEASLREMIAFIESLPKHGLVVDTGDRDFTEHERRALGVFVQAIKDTREEEK